MELRRVVRVFHHCDVWLVCHRKGVFKMKIKKLYQLFITMMSFYLIASTREAYGLTNEYERIIVLFTILIGAAIASWEVNSDD